VLNEKRSKNLENIENKIFSKSRSNIRFGESVSSFVLTSPNKQNFKSVRNHQNQELSEKGREE